MTERGEPEPDSNLERIARAFGDKGGRSGRTGRRRLEAYVSGVREALEKQGLEPDAIDRILEQASSESMPSELIAARFVERNRRRAAAAAEQQSRMAEVAKRLAADQVQATARNDEDEVERLAREQRSIEVAELTLAAAEAIREAVVDGTVAAADREEAAEARERRMELITWALLLFALLTLIATILSVASN